MNLRKLHRQAAPLVFFPLLLAALTGVAYRIGSNLLDIPDNVANIFMVLHQGEFLGEPLMPVYVLLMGLGLVGMIITGLSMLLPKKASKAQPRRDHRWLHRILSIIGLLPLTISALTGVAYAIGTSWLGLSPRDIGFLLRLHQGYYLGSILWPLYVLVLGVGLVALLITGITMTPVFRKRRSASGG
ncbi:MULTISPECIES: PepSY-associated TM helix domain-containing protein [unclassified Leptolyngbya]|uniref:PepSY-associated TM helix domain-containing protein n=1 Tax=unclassified Leptolyngbya TaxID=2650499 RepID=UPI001686E665|nr:MULTISPECIES: PepSY-associated TM helix domain-containing protein [unclassified Leptolyngbya]MBD1912026.1 PepSY domain-containing protein [Leptolyngbya sp. FACHB-8]MBD2155396.1 PepSY domain-containing protein [Leptolyngbya sp. FACHB-16]